MSLEFCVVDDITLGIMVDAAKYQQFCTSYTLLFIFLRNKNSVLNFLLNMHFRVKKEKVTVARRIYYKIKSLSDNKTNSYRFTPNNK